MERSGQAAACRAGYEAIAAGVRGHGILPEEIAKSRQLCRHVDGGFVVRETAYKPTGLALGCPLPDSGFTLALQEIVREFAVWTDEGCGEPGAGFAFVPPAWYHATVVNYTHFDDVSRWSEVVELPEAALRLVEEHLRRASHPAPRVRFRGLLLTDSGRLLVPGHALNDTVFALRRELVNLEPRFAEHLPTTIHMKLGHLLRLPGPESLAAGLDLADQLGRRIDRDLIFPALHSPRRVLSVLLPPEAPSPP